MTNKPMPQPYPWDEKTISPAAKMVATLGVIAVLLCIALPIFTSWIIGSIATMSEAPAFSLFGIVMGLIILGGCFYGARYLWRYASQPTENEMTKSYTPTDAQGQRFAVRFLHLRTNRTFNGPGEVRFGAEGLHLEGRLEPSIGFQLLVILIVTFVPLLLFKIGLGLIPALLLAAYLGREEASYTIPYTELRGLVVKGRTAVVQCIGEYPQKTKFRVAPGDGERLYRELQQYYPQAVVAWDHLLVA